MPIHLHRIERLSDGYNRQTVQPEANRLGVPIGIYERLNCVVVDVVWPDELGGEG